MLRVSGSNNRPFAKAAGCALLSPGLHPQLKGRRSGVGYMVLKPLISISTAQVQRGAYPPLEDDHDKPNFV